MNHFLLNVIADGGTKNNGPDFGKASPVGLVVVLLLVVATVFLIRSMNKQLKKVPESFDRQNPEPDQAADEGTDAAGGVGSGGLVGPDGPDGSDSSDSKGPAGPPGSAREPG